MSERDLTIKDRLEDILESIGLIEEWSQGMTELHDFMNSLVAGINRQPPGFGEHIAGE